MIKLFYYLPTQGLIINFILNKSVTWLKILLILLFRCGYYIQVRKNWETSMFFFWLGGGGLARQHHHIFYAYDSKDIVITKLRIKKHRITILVILCL